MGYRLGVDLGTTFTAAAVGNGEPPSMLGLGDRALQVPSVVFLTEDGEFLIGDAAERRGRTDPARVVREFKRRIGDPVPLLVAGIPFSPQALTARLLAWVVTAAIERMGAEPDELVLTYPANWGGYKRELLSQVIALADIGAARTCPGGTASGRSRSTRRAPACGPTAGSPSTTWVVGRSTCASWRSGRTPSSRCWASRTVWTISVASTSTRRCSSTCSPCSARPPPISIRAPRGRRAAPARPRTGTPSRVRLEPARRHHLGDRLL